MASTGLADRLERYLFDRRMKALSDPTRRRILEVLAGGQMNVSRIVGRFSLSQPTISRHLSVLRDALLVDAERRGQKVFYSLTKSGEQVLATVTFLRDESKSARAVAD